MRGHEGAPAWNWLTDGDLDALANYVRFLAEVGLADDQEEEAQRLGEPFEREAAEQRARELMCAGAP